MGDYNNYTEILDAVISSNITSIQEFMRTFDLHTKYVSDYKIEQKWVAANIEATFFLEARLIIMLMELPPLISRKALLHEAGHILLGHQGNYLLSTTPVSGSNVEHAANMVSYALIIWFALCDHADEGTQVYIDLQDMASAYEIPSEDLDYFAEAYALVMNKTANEQFGC